MEQKKKRVISPFLTVYKPQYSSMFSILERITGVFIFVFMLLFFVLNKLSVLSLSYYSFYSLLYTTLIGNSDFMSGLVLFFLLNLSYHFFFGLRFIYWDRTGGVLDYGLNLSVLVESSHALLLSTIVSSLVTFIFLIVI